MNESQFDDLLGYLGPSNLKTVKKLYDPSVYPYPSNLGSYSQWYHRSVRNLSMLIHLFLCAHAHTALMHACVHTCCACTRAHVHSRTLSFTLHTLPRWWMAIRVGTDHGIPFHGYPNGCAFGHCSARRVAMDLVQAGTPAVYMYLFARPVVGHWVGHASEIPFVFHMSPVLLSPGNLKLSSQMVAYWTQFATSANPSSISIGRPQWPPFSPAGNKSSLRLDATFLTANITVENNLRGAACDFWDNLTMMPSVLNLA